MANEDDLKTWLQNYRQTSTDDQSFDIQLLKEQAAANYDLVSRFSFGKGKTLLHVAVERNQRTLIQGLLEVLTLPQLIDLLDKKTDSERPYSIHCDGATAIHFAALYNRHEILTDILGSLKSTGCSPLRCLMICNDYMCTPLYIAALNNKLEVLESMFEAVTPSERLLLITSKGLQDNTNLHLAARKGSLQLVKLIQKYTTGDQMFNIMKTKHGLGLFGRDYTILHDVVSSGAPSSADMIRALMDPLTDRQKVDILEISARYAGTAKELASHDNHHGTAELLEEIYTKAIISICLDTSDRDEKRKLLEMIRLYRPLSTQQIEELYPHFDRYVIPHNQEKAKQHAIILYNREKRPGADEEADDLSSALKEAACVVTRQAWSCVNELQSMIVDGLLALRESCSFLMVCLMSHGSTGCLQDSDCKEIAINTILKLLAENIPPHIPLVILIQACQGSRYGIKLQSTSHTDPAVAGASISMEDKKVDLLRPHSLLLQASLTGEVAYRGKYTGAMADQIRQADDIRSIYDMEMKAREKVHKLGQVPKMTTTLMTPLILPGKPTESEPDVDSGHARGSKRKFLMEDVEETEPSGYLAVEGEVHYSMECRYLRRDSAVSIGPDPGDHCYEMTRHCRCEQHMPPRPELHFSKRCIWRRIKDHTENNKIYLYRKCQCYIPQNYSL